MKKIKQQKMLKGLQNMKEIEQQKIWSGSVEIMNSLKNVTLVFTVMAGTLLAADKPAEQRAFEMVKAGQLGVCASMMDKTPYNSLMPYALDDGMPIVYISDLAQHTDNLNKDGKASFLVLKKHKGNIHNSARASFQGRFVKATDDKEVKRLFKIYVKKFPRAKIYAQLHDFNLYRLEKVENIHFIGGFGDIHWLDVEDYLKAAK